MAPVIGRVHQERQRHFEDRRDLERIDAQRDVGLHQPDDRRDDEAGAGRVGRHRPEDFDLRGFEADLLVGLAQRGRGGVGVARFDAAAGKADLARVIGQVIGALRQQHRQLVAQHQRHEDRGVRRLAIAEAALDLDLGRPDRRRGEARAQRCRREARGVDRRQMVVDAEDRQVLRVEGQRHRLCGHGSRRVDLSDSRPAFP